MYQAVPENLSNDTEHRRQLARATNNLLKGKMNCNMSVTLTASASSTTVVNSLIASTSHFSFTPTTAHAAAELASGNMYVPLSTIVPAYGTTPGKAVIQHTNNSQTDRTFILAIIG